MDSQSERDRLKEEYKEHFRKMRETREKVTQAVRVEKISKAVSNMNAEAIFDSMGEMMDTLKEKIALAEAKIEMALESYKEVEKEPVPPATPDQPKNSAARQALQQIKLEMGLVYSDLEKEAEQLKQQQKTMGRTTDVQPDDDGSRPQSTKKTIGKSPE